MPIRPLNLTLNRLFATTVKIFNRIPECGLKYTLLIEFKNLLLKPRLNVHYRNNLYHVLLDGYQMRFREDPCHELRFCIPAYVDRYKPKRGDTVIDVGAYPGIFTVYLSRLVGREGHVIAFEPDEANFDHLEETLAMNSALHNVTLIKKGLWSTNTNISLKKEGYTSHVTENGVGKLVEVCMLDNELQKIGIKDVNYIKMDIEGSEIEALKGCINTISKPMTRLVIATYHLVDGKPSFIEITRMLQNFNLQVVTFNDMHLTTYVEKSKAMPTPKVIVPSFK